MNNAQQIDAVEYCKSEIKLFIYYQIVDISNTLEKEINMIEELKYAHPEEDINDIIEVINYYETQINYYNMLLEKLLR